jgi:enamine deaminase RidA (YjgF/YER057c/UK114 family)
MLMQRVSANWSAAVSGGRRGAHDSLANLTDQALAARQRLERALDAAGPELSGVIVDICCYLKGVEQVERERQWPQRSAKLMLKAALGSLARHYNPAPKPASGGFRHWGGEGYRPEIR